MRTASARFVMSSITLICLVAISCTFTGVASAQSGGKSKRKALRESGLSPVPLAGRLAAAKSGAIPPLTADSWTGSAGNDSWNTAGNWSLDAVPTSSDAVTISTASANVDLYTGAVGAAGSLTIGSGDTLSVDMSEILTDSGTLTNSGTLYVGTSTGGAGNVTIQGATTNSGTIAVSNGSTLTVDGNISGAGALQLNSTSSGTALVLSGNVTLSGGTLTLSNSSQNYIYGSNSLDQLTNEETISGAGQLGNGSMALANSGTINANASPGLTINANEGFTNTGTVEATGGNTLTLNSTNVTNTGGTFSANASIVTLNSSIIQG